MPGRTGSLFEALSNAPTYQIFDPGAPDIERQTRNVWRVLRENPAAHEASPWLEARLGEIARDIRALAVDYDDRNALWKRRSPCQAGFIEGAPGRRGKKAVKSPSSRRKGHTW